MNWIIKFQKRSTEQNQPVSQKELDEFWQSTDDTQPPAKKRKNNNSPNNQEQSANLNQWVSLGVVCLNAVNIEIFKSSEQTTGFNIRFQGDINFIPTGKNTAKKNLYTTPIFPNTSAQLKSTLKENILKELLKYNKSLSDIVTPKNTNACPLCPKMYNKGSSRLFNRHLVSTHIEWTNHTGIPITKQGRPLGTQKIFTLSEENKKLFNIKYEDTTIVGPFDISHREPTRLTYTIGQQSPLKSSTEQNYLTDLKAYILSTLAGQHINALTTCPYCPTAYKGDRNKFVKHISGHWSLIDTVRNIHIPAQNPPHKIYIPKDSLNSNTWQSLNRTNIDGTDIRIYKTTQALPQQNQASFTYLKFEGNFRFNLITYQSNGEDRLYTTALNNDPKPKIDQQASILAKLINEVPSLSETLGFDNVCCPVCSKSFINSAKVNQRAFLRKHLITQHSIWNDTPSTDAEIDEALREEMPLNPEETLNEFDSWLTGNSCLNDEFFPNE